MIEALVRRDNLDLADKMADSDEDVTEQLLNWGIELTSAGKHRRAFEFARLASERDPLLETERAEDFGFIYRQVCRAERAPPEMSLEACQRAEVLINSAAEVTKTDNACAPIPQTKYDTLAIVGPPTDRPAAEHADLNLSLRGYSPVDAFLGLIDLPGLTDSRAPQLSGLFADRRLPEITNVYQVNNWDWSANSPGEPIQDFEVTLAGFGVERGEAIYVPEAGFVIGKGFQVLVLYADDQRLTLKYTSEDNVVGGYSLHIEGICIEPKLSALYEETNQAGRDALPALTARQPFGRARSDEIQVAIRDLGRFMDPRVRKDWWQQAAPPEPDMASPTAAPTPAPTPLATATPTPFLLLDSDYRVQWGGSPNFNSRRNPTDITAIVMNASANSSQESVVKWYNNPNAQVSMHYTIGKEGTIVQHVLDRNRAWHAGRSAWKGRDNLNDFSIGVEFINLNDGLDPYPEAQHEAAVRLVAFLVDKYDIALDDIVAHYDVADPPGRKTDPRGYDMERLRREVAEVTGRPLPPTVTPTPAATATPTPTATATPAPVRLVQVQGGGPENEWRYGLAIISGPTGETIKNLILYAGAPAWSPDGKQIAFYAEENIRNLGAQWQAGAGVWLISDTGTDARLLQRIENGENMVWSPDGSKLALEIEPSAAEKTHQIVILEANSGQELSRFQGEQPAWIPDGSDHLVIRTSSGLKRIDSQGAEVGQFTSIGSDFFPYWSPDGQYLTFASRERDDDWEIYVVRMIAGQPEGEPKRLTNRLGTDTTPVFSADSGEIYFRAHYGGNNWNIEAITVGGADEEPRLVREGVGSSETWGIVRPAVHN